MIKTSIKFIHRLRIFFFFFILISFFYTAGLTPGDFLQFVGVGSSSADGVSSSASVAKNPINTLAMQLKEKEEMLDTKERQLEERETDLRSESSVLQNRVIKFMMAGIIILFVLILLNFINDWRRRNKK